MRPLSGYSNCLCEALDAVALYGAAVYIRDATLRGCDTSEHCGSVAFAFRRRDGRLCEMALKQVHDQPLQKTQDDFSHRVVGTERTNKGRSLVSGGLPQPKAHQSDYGEGRRPWPPTRPRAPPHGIPKGSARAGRVQRGRLRRAASAKD